MAYTPNTMHIHEPSSRGVIAASVFLADKTIFIAFNTALKKP